MSEGLRPLTPGQRAALAHRFGQAVRFDRPLAPYTSARIGGPADALLTVSTAEDLAEATTWLWAQGLPFVVLGGGSNVLIADAGIRGVVVLNRAREGIWQPTGEALQVQVASGAALGTVARRSVAEGWQGLEWAVGVPGTVGGAVVGNAGAFGGDMAQVLEAVEVLDLLPEGRSRRLWLAVDALELAYRSSIFKRGGRRSVILQATLTLKRPTNPAALQAWVQRIQAQRRATQPPGASMGSMFKNPPHDAAGRLIDAAGLKGLRRGDAEISPLHANFFLNRGRATARQVWELLVFTRREVYRRWGVLLEPEIQLLGAWTPEERAALYAPEPPVLVGGFL